MACQEEITAEKAVVFSFTEPNSSSFDAAKRLGIPQSHITVVEEQESAKARSTARNWKAI